jgi:hypothetical protein
MRAITANRCFLPVKPVTVVLFALLLATGPLGLLQVVAWTGMVFDYGARYGLVEGLERTFDGRNPCGLCEKITEARRDGVAADSGFVLPSTKLVGVTPATACAPAAALQRQPHRYFLVPEFFPVRAERPALPPPRVFAA